MQFLHKFYAASISIGLDGSMLIESTRERFLIWAMLFCFLAAASLTCFLLSRGKLFKQISLSLLLISLLIPALIIPSFKHESIHVNRDYMKVDSGFWFNPRTIVIELKNLRKLTRINNEYRVSNLIGDDHITWSFERNTGTVQQLVLNQFLSAHSMAVAHYIRDRGYAVEWLAVLETTVPEGFLNRQ